jgi:hypothetical protein
MRKKGEKKNHFLSKNRQNCPLRLTLFPHRKKCCPPGKKILVPPLHKDNASSRSRIFPGISEVAELDIVLIGLLNILLNFPELMRLSIAVPAPEVDLENKSYMQFRFFLENEFKN